MTWHETCSDFDSRIEASALEANFNDTVFLLTQADADDDAGDKVFANKAIISLVSPVFYAQFYGPLATRDDAEPVEIVDGTAKGFKQLINFICQPKSFEFQVQNVVEVFDISYFAHKYQIGSLVSRCRRALSDYNLDGNEVNILKWVISSERGMELKETFPAEHALLVHNVWECIPRRFQVIFPNGALMDDQDLPDEDLMMDILRRRSRFLEEEFTLSVAMDYYCKLMDKRHKVDKNQKRIKIDIENEWNNNLAKIKTVVKLEKVRPKKLAEIYEKFVHKIPDIIIKITQEIATSWKDKDTFPFSRRTDIDSLFEIPFILIDHENNDWIHDGGIPSEAQMKFKTNQNAVLHMGVHDILGCSCNDTYCCLIDSITFQNEDYKEEVALIPGSYHFYFYVKENKEFTLTYRKKCDSCDLHLVKMTEFRLSKGNFEVNILEVNGQPVTSPCYTFVDGVCFTPI